jgi:hypothetical protein
VSRFAAPADHDRNEIAEKATDEHAHEETRSVVTFETFRSIHVNITRGVWHTGLMNGKITDREARGGPRLSRQLGREAGAVLSIMESQLSLTA